MHVVVVGESVTVLVGVTDGLEEEEGVPEGLSEERVGLDDGFDEREGEDDWVGARDGCAESDGLVETEGTQDGSSDGASEGIPDGHELLGIKDSVG